MPAAELLGQEEGQQKLLGQEEEQQGQTEPKEPPMG